jgi:peptidoglycan hydrolase-like protein with peptidoglycan-binding domain
MRAGRPGADHDWMFPTLSRGDHGDDVALLQRALRDMGYDVGPIDGDFGAMTENAVTNYQLDQNIDNTVEPGGVCGESTWASIEANFGNLDGLRSEAVVEGYVDGAHEVWHASMSADERILALQDEINEALAAADVPNVDLVFDSGVAHYAEFDMTIWTVRIQPSHLEPEYAATLTEAGMAEISGAVFAEARVAEQWYEVARVLAGRHGLDSQTISEQLGIQIEIAMLAFANPSPELTLTAGAAYEWYSAAYGAGEVPHQEYDPTGADGAIHREWREHNDGGQPEAVAQPTLRRGDYNNEQVSYLQQLLQWRGLYAGHAVDGDFGPRTEEAVKAFQGDSGLAGDGVVGPQTWAALLP